MPNPQHESILVRLSAHPEQLGLLVEAATGRALPRGLQPVQTTLRQSKDLNPDLVLTNPRNDWAILENQLKKKPVKGRRWALMVALATDERGRPGDFIVLTASRAVGAWALTVASWRTPRGTESRLRPIVVVLDERLARKLLDRKEPASAWFAAWAVRGRKNQGAIEVVERALEVCDALGPAARAEQRDILRVLEPSLLAAFKEVVMKNQEAKPNKAYLQFIKDFEKIGEARGQAIGEARGEARGESRALLLVMARRGLKVSAAVTKRVLACTDLKQLERWLINAATAESTAEVFQSP